MQHHGAACGAAQAALQAAAAPGRAAGDVIAFPELKELKAC